MQPICVKCGRQMKCEKNGFKIEQFSDKDKTEPYKKFRSDKYKCPECGVEVVVNVASEPMAVRHEPDYNDYKVDLGFF